ncbi:type I secretion system permease/ATPase [Thauera sp. CAU 1555]|uniref:Type I secretion system permease/ATPase n=1 Tax=Thauera sedimentorum TaxID=2767595 RepID=A0ABR9B922_9RHOO|nr:type I secretion system permease/ATPase [Thauera sedimentorum]MBC9071574.1 type I secretion system permease/ATPase [Thauera sedimentorum]MBD8502493.1 type I secretion system permease/ATPase [Thauera sedimentorum]
MILDRLPRGELSASLSAYRRVFAAVAGFSLTINLLLLAPALYMLQTYDRVLTSRNEGTLIVLTALLFGLLALEAALEWTRSQVMSRTAAALELGLDRRVFDAGFDIVAKGGHSLGQALSDLVQLRQFLIGKGLIAFFDAPWLPVFLIVIALLNPWLGLFGVLATLLLVSMAWINERATASLTVTAQQMSASANRWADASARNAEVVSALGMLPNLRDNWLQQHRAALALAASAGERNASLGGGVRFARLFLQSAILGLGAYLVLRDQLTPGGMIAASILLGRALAPLDLAIANWRSFVGARQAYLRVHELLGTQPLPQPSVTLPRPNGLVQVEQLFVAAPGQNVPILKGVGFEVQPGQIMAIVGPSASGKSTLARALVGVWPPAGGAVRLDGAELGGWRREDLGPHIGYLPQDVELFEGTVAENIARFGELDSARVIQAAQRAGVHELILRLSDGYETKLGWDGQGSAVLSAGQRQRIALARALYGDPVLIVLDEPNANLDEAGDAALVRALKDLRSQGRTVFVVTHRTHLLGETDGVIFMHEGRVLRIAATAELQAGGVSAPAFPHLQASAAGAQRGVA